MRILVEFKNPETDEEHELVMDGPEMDPDELRELVMEALDSIWGISFPSGMEFKITEIAHGTIH